jgi:Fuc2NAc and GlcNAc transferase
VVRDVAVILLAAGFAAGLALGWGALRLALLAYPNDRSSHVRPTPTAGGVAFALPLIAYLVWLGWLGAAPALVLGAGSAALALCGFWDDLRELPASVRLLLHAVVAVAVVWVVLPGSGWLLGAVLVVALVWHVNLYNFMDGIDALAAVQALVFLIGAQIIAGGIWSWSGDVGWLACGALAAFLTFNWPPARMFMGDTGSAFLGLFTGTLALLWWQEDVVPLASSLILLAGFWFDATYTLIVRVVSGQAFTQAHRSHLYQKVAAKRGHLWTTLGYLLISALWLLPLSWLCAMTSPELSLRAFAWVGLAVAPLAIAAWRLGAGLPEREGRRSIPL